MVCRCPGCSCPNFIDKNGNPVYSSTKMETLFFPPTRHLSGVCLRGVPVPAVLLPQFYDKNGNPVYSSKKMETMFFSCQAPVRSVLAWCAGARGARAPILLIKTETLFFLQQNYGNPVFFLPGTCPECACVVCRCPRCSCPNCRCRDLSEADRTRIRSGQEITA